MKRTILELELRPKIISLIEAESGKYTIDALVRKLMSESEHVNFETVDSVVHAIRGGSIKMNREGKLEFVPPYEEQRELPATWPPNVQTS
jgi:hypothetical protein